MTNFRLMFAYFWSMFRLILTNFWYYVDIFSWIDFLCIFKIFSEIKYAKPKRGKTAQGVWKDIVNVNDYTQTLRMEKCLKPGGSCSYVSHHYKSQCSQVYNYHRLLSWDKTRGLHMDIYKVRSSQNAAKMQSKSSQNPAKMQ